MAESTKFHAFTIQPFDKSPNLEDLLEVIKDDDLPKRVRGVYGADLRIGDITKKENFWFLDFDKFRPTHGPGKAAKSTPVVGFRFGDGEVFAEETACLYVPSRKKLIVQYNHYGARAGTMQEYFNSYTTEPPYAFELRPIFDDQVVQRFERRQSIQKVEFRIDPRSFSKSDKTMGKTLTKALDIGTDTKGENLELTIFAGKRKRWTDNAQINALIKFLREKAKRDQDSVQKLQVTIQASLDARLEVLDLLEERLCIKLDGLKVGADLRFPREDRYRALERAYNGLKGRL